MSNPWDWLEREVSWTAVGHRPLLLAATGQDRSARQHSMAVDIVGSDALALPESHEPLLAAIAAAAATTDRHGVSRGTFDALAAAGLLWAGPWNRPRCSGSWPSGCSWPMAR